MQDMVSKGRNADTSGEQNGRAKLSWEEVSSIRDEHSSGITLSRLARRYGIPESTVSNIVHNRTWKDSGYSPKNILPANRSITQEIYDKVFHLRDKGLTQSAIGIELGISQTGVWRILSGNAKIWSSE